MEQSNIYHANQRQYQYYTIIIILIVSYLLLRGVTWNGSTQLHTIMEVMATILSALVGILALIRYYTRKTNLFLYIGTGFLGTAFLDGYHGFVTSEYFSALVPSPPTSLIPWSWIASRLYLSVMLWISSCAYIWVKHDHNNEYINEKYIFIVSGILTLMCFILFAFVPMPQAYYPTWWIHRPEEIVPALFFGLALYNYWKQGLWKDHIFEHWLMISLLVNFIGQIMFMSFSNQLFDTMFDVAHLLKKLSYIAVLTGLLIGIYKLFKQSEDDTTKILNKLSYEINEMVKQLTPSIVNMQNVTTQLIENANIINSAIQNTSVSVGQIKYSVENNNRKSVKVVQDAIHTQSVSEEGTEAVKNTISGMERIQSHMNDIGIHIIDLVNKNSDIIEIVKSVDELTSQINVVSVNASIEAAKAGEVGTGFSVVAKQIKSLVKQSQESTTKIKTIIYEIQKATHTLINKAEKGSHVVQQGMELSNQTLDSIQTLGSHIHNATDTITAIVKSGKELLEGINKINHSINEIRNSCTEFLNITNQTNTVSDQISEISSTLQTLTNNMINSQYKNNDRNNQI